jgi:hypothetical protein
VGGQRYAPADLHPKNSPGTHYAGGKLDFGAIMDGYEKSRPPVSFQYRTAQSVGSRYMDCAISATTNKIMVRN